MEEQVSHALEALLAARHVTASIEAAPDVDLGSAEIKAITYHLTQPIVQVGPLSFTGAGAEWASAVAQVAVAQSGKEYAESATPALLREAVLHAYKAKGYAEAAVPALTPTRAGKQGPRPVYHRRRCRRAIRPRNVPTRRFPAHRAGRLP